MSSDFFVFCRWPQGSAQAGAVAPEAAAAAGSSWYPAAWSSAWLPGSARQQQQQGGAAALDAHPDDLMYILAQVGGPKSDVSKDSPHDG